VETPTEVPTAETPTETPTTPITPTVPTPTTEDVRSKLELELSSLQLDVSRATSRPKISELVSKYNSLLGTYRSLGVVVPELDVWFNQVRNLLGDRVGVVVEDELRGIDVWNEAHWDTLNSLEAWLNSLKSQGVPVPDVVYSKVVEKKNVVESIKAVKERLTQTFKVGDERSRSELIDDLSSRLARFYTIAEFVSKDTWYRLKEGLGLKDSDLELISRLARGESLSDSELRRISEVYMKLQLNPLFDKNDPIGQLIEAEISKLRPTYAGAEPLGYYTLSELEKELKEKILKGEVPQVSPGRQVIWSIEDTLKLADVIGKGYDAVYNFLRDRGLPSGVASAIASALITAPTLIAMKFGGPVGVVAYSVIGTSLANFVSQMGEYLTDEYERKLVLDEFSKVLDPSQAPPELRAQYEEARDALIGSVVGAVGTYGVIKASPKIAEVLSKVLRSRFPQLADKLSTISQKYLALGELQAKTQDSIVLYDREKGILQINLFEGGDVTKIKATAKIPIREEITVVTEKTRDHIVGLVKVMSKITGKDDVSDEVNTVFTRAIDELKKSKLPINDETLNRVLGKVHNFLDDLANQMPQELRGRSLIEIAQRLTVVSKDDVVTPALNLGDKVVIYVGGKPVSTSTGALASVEVVDRLKSLGIFDDVVNIVRKGIAGDKGVIIRSDKGIYAEVYPDKIVITRGLQKETFSLFPSDYMLEAKSLLESYDPTILKTLSQVVTAPYGTTPITQLPVTPAEFVDAFKNFVKEAGKFTDISLVQDGKSARVLYSKELLRVGDEKLFRSIHDIVFAKSRSVLDNLLGDLGYERYRTELLIFGKKTRDFLNKYMPTDLSKLSKEELKAVLSKALSEATDPEVVKALQQVQVAVKAMESAPSETIPLVISDTGNELVIAVASTTSLTQLSSKQIRELGLDEKELTAKLRPVYDEVPQLIPITVPKEVVVTVPTHDVVYEKISKDEVVNLKPNYEIVRQDIPIYKEVEEIKPIYVGDTEVIALWRDEVVKLRPIYKEVIQLISTTIPKEVTKTVTVPEVTTYHITTSEDVKLRPVYDEVVKEIPITVPKETIEVVTEPKEDIMYISARQLADVVVVPVEELALIEVYAPYTEPLPATLPPHLLALGAIPGVPIMPTPAGEELAVKPEVRKPKEVEKVVL